MNSNSLFKAKLQSSVYLRKDIHNGKKNTTFSVNSFINNPINNKKSNTLRLNDSQQSLTKSNKHLGIYLIIAEKNNSSMNKLNDSNNLRLNTINLNKIESNNNEDNAIELINLKLNKKNEKENIINSLNLSNPINFFKKQKYNLDMNYISK